MPFWLGQHIQIDGDLMRGDWILLFSHQGCPKCDEAVSEYEKRAAARANAHEAPAMAVIEVSRLNNPASFSAWSGLRGFLSQDREWFVRTPFELRLRDGIVQNATYELPLLSDATFDQVPDRERQLPVVDDGV